MGDFLCIYETQNMHLSFSKICIYTVFKICKKKIYEFVLIKYACIICAYIEKICTYNVHLKLKKYELLISR